MNSMNLLWDEFKLLINNNSISSQEVPFNIKDNINQKFTLRKYQIEALNSLIYYNEKSNKKKRPIHLLFNMATGSGKTLLMATNILYLYEKGYRNFIFFVDSTNIIEKTRNNFLDWTGSKYLFSQYITMDNRQVKIRQINNLDEADKDSINIVFTTIQGLHYNMNNPSENSITYEDFKDRKVVLLSDEAHHINTMTKKRLNKTEKEMKSSWEHTITTILNSNLENILLEYTATIGLENKEIFDKYKDKIIYKYDLKNYREDKYSKEIAVLRSEMSIKHRMLQGVILSEYRRKVAEKKGLLLKPVILIKSNTIGESKSIKEKFLNGIYNLTSEDMEEIISNSKDNIINRAFKYFEKENISMENLIIEIQNHFSEERCIEVNSKNDSEEKQIIVNTLEDKDNPFRVVFAVNMLNEGWDVLNLFDIVRVNEGRGTKNTTIKEAQLIGRGARYYPFKLEEGEDEYKRKFDGNLDNEARILETLHYHSINESQYISQLRAELERIGIVGKDAKETKVKARGSSVYKEESIPSNRKKTNHMDINSLEDMKIKRKYDYYLRSKGTFESTILDEDGNIRKDNFKELLINIKDIPYNILRKGISINKFYTFENLKRYFPNIKSIDEFISSRNYLGNMVINILGEHENLTSLSNDELLSAFLFILVKVERQILKI